jgi:hypothetical protein
MDDFELFIAGDTKQIVDPDQLKLLAKRAAAEYVKEETPLNDSIKELAKEASLNAEQTKRVIEMANTETFVRLFSGNYDKNIDFDVADPEAILSHEKTASHTPRPAYRISSKYVPGQEYVDLDEVFASDSESEKTGEDEWTSKKTHEYLDLRAKVKHATADLHAQANVCELSLVALRTSLERTVNEGAPLGEAIVLIKEAGVPKEVLRLVTEGVEDPRPFETRTVREPNTEHPLYKAASDFVGSAARFYGTLDMVTGLTERAVPESYPDWWGLMQEHKRIVEVE